MSANNIITVNLNTDVAAVRVQKTERVTVHFAAVVGELESLEGANRYHVGDAIVQARQGNAWVVERARFIEKYAAVAPLVMGADGLYDALPQVILAKRMAHNFALHRKLGGDLLHGSAGDWVLQYAPGDFGVCAQARFAQVYAVV